MKRSVPAGVLILLCIAGCGKVGDPRPPLIRIPAQIGDLKAVQSNYDIVLSWTNPAKYVDGANATDLTEFAILRNGSRILSSKVSGAGKTQTVSLDVSGDVGKSNIYTVEVATERGKLSSVSNGVPIAIVDVPGIVTMIGGEMDQGQIRVRWVPPLSKPMFADLYLVRREDLSTVQIVRETHFEDAAIEVGKTYRYFITPARNGNPPVPGPPSAAFSVPAVDKIPPRAPTGLQPLVVSESGATLRWEQNTESDIAGYRIYRSDNPNSGFVRLEEAIHASPTFRDPAYRPGFYYTVSAVDDNGNEGAQSAAIRAAE